MATTQDGAALHRRLHRVPEPGQSDGPSVTAESVINDPVKRGAALYAAGHGDPDARAALAEARQVAEHFSTGDDAA